MRSVCCQLASYIMFDIDGLNCFNGVKGAACLLDSLGWER